MLAGVRFGSCAHVRPATLIEENVHCGHAVGLKQTILFPFVRLGSLINFCDCLTAGGSSDKSHSEVGSSYVHFNYSPRGDKATASLAGDVPRGVMLDQEPIFLGGQGGLVGPTRIEYGTVIAAGVICRRDILKRGRLVFGQGPQRPGEVDYKPALSADIDRLVRNNLAYIGNLCALTEWYRHVRSLSLARDRYDIACLKGALNVLDIMLRERCKQFNELIKNTVAVTKVRAPRQGNRMQGRMQVIRARLMRWWPKVLPQLESGALTGMDKKNRDTFLSGIQVARSRSTHLDLMSKTSQSLRRVGTTWLQSMVDSTMKLFAD
jgi:UDP-N-acetylglucosamine/UDP-N-acetylgalactosamine diphosphorylase